MRSTLKILSICVMALTSTFAFSDSPTVQFTYGKVYSQGFIEFTRNSDQEVVQENFVLDGQAIDLKYIYSPYTAISLSFHMLEGCKIEEAKTKFGCHIASPIEGGNIEFLTGINMDGKGLFAYTGVGYYMEVFRDVEQSDLYIPVGVGINLNMFVIEAKYELRNSDYYDATQYDLFTANDPDYSYSPDWNMQSIAPAEPITFSVGVRF